MTPDEEHLQLLSIFHYVVGGLIALIGCFPMIHLGMGIALVTGNLDEGLQDEGPPVAWIGWFFIVIALFIIGSAWGMAIATIIAGRKLAARRSRTFCIVIAALLCMFMPFGTALGVFTLIVLMRPSVEELFRSSGDGSAEDSFHSQTGFSG